MTIEQTIEIPAGTLIPRLHLDLPLPQKHPVGKVRVKVELDEEASAVSSLPAKVEWVNPLRGLAKGSDLTMEHFMELQQEDIRIENEADQRLWGGK
jgi:hypothetical protein